MPTPNGTVRIAMLGVGRIGRMHAEIVAREVTGAELVAVHDAAPGLATEVAASLGVPALSLEAILASESVDAVGICSATPAHVPTITAAAAAGKAIFCEKPVSSSIPETDEALAAVAAAGVPFMVGFNRRFDPSHRAVRRAVAEGAIGQVELVRITSRDSAPPPDEYIAVSGGMFLDMSVHDFDMAPYIVGSPVVEVYAKGAVRVSEAFARYGDIDTAVVVLTHADGTLSTIDNSRRAVYGYDQRVEAFGSQGMASSANVPVHVTTVATAEGTRGAEVMDFFISRYRDAYVEEWREFVRYVRDGGPSPVPGIEGRAPLVVAEAANLSLAERRPVRIEEIEARLRDRT